MTFRSGKAQVSSKDVESYKIMLSVIMDELGGIMATSKSIGVSRHFLEKLKDDGRLTICNAELIAKAHKQINEDRFIDRQFSSLLLVEWNKSGLRELAV